MDSKLITIDELANTLRVKRSWVYRKTKEKGPGTIPRLKVGKYLRFRHDAVLAWLEEQNGN